MFQEIYDFRQSQEKWQQNMFQETSEFRQVQEKRQQTQEGKIDKLIYWVKWVVAAGIAVSTSVLANLIWEVIIKK